ncbi:hypothetical protein DFP72DRAFT_598330 [Ephemerocybe angulata]|uniref:Uncharacterized protein n=1 Tax=Ephemerocybe angulata TaxID=980116 RepID=A0A8H6IAZ4_9AGAR|nr:hypothetical protein DFP72DRAFT_598330 [Tulosesus angulatus]
MSGEIDEDAISLESLQAQIDLSMSFATSLVSSWVKPQKKTGSSRSRDLEKELLEATSRRPRLGVGAAASEQTSLPRETIRLKGQLVGKKRSREQEEVDAMKKRDEEDDEEESRGGAIKKKVKVDPFAKPNKKKSSVLAVVPGPSQPRERQGKHASSGPTEEETTEPSPKKKKKAKAPTPSEATIKSSANSDSENARSVSPTVPIATQNKSSTPRKAREVEESLKLDVLSTTSSSGASNDLSLPSASKSHIRLSTAALVKPRDIPSSSNLPGDLLNKPILNLHEISSDNESDDGNMKSTPSSPKKKRRRRKKKKSAVDNHTSPQPAPSSTVKILIS